MHPGTKHSLTDDLESFFHVLSWVSLHYVKHDIGPIPLTRLLDNMYLDSQLNNNGEVIGGELKSAYIVQGKLADAGFASHLGALIEKLELWFASRYAKYDPEEATRWFKEYNESSELEKKSLEKFLPHGVRIIRRQEDLESAAWMMKQFEESFNAMNSPGEPLVLPVPGQAAPPKGSNSASKPKKPRTGSSSDVVSAPARRSTPHRAAKSGVSYTSSLGPTHEEDPNYE
jgi:hypothetical protein